MIKNKTVLTGVITAMILSASTVYANDDVKDFYKYIVQSEIVSGNETEIFSVMDEVVQKDVDQGRITPDEALHTLQQLKNDFKS